jgi:hypothetical protein
MKIFTGHFYYQKYSFEEDVYENKFRTNAKMSEWTVQ